MDFRILIRKLADYSAFILMLPLFIPAILIVASICRHRTIRKQKLGIKPNIIWGPHPIKNIVYNSNAVRARGYNSKTLVYQVYRINDKSDFDYVIATTSSRVMRNFLIRCLAPYIFLQLYMKYDIFHFYFSGGFLNHTPLRRHEYQLLKLGGKKVIVSPFGGDVTLFNKIRNKHKWNISTDSPKGYQSSYVAREIEKDIAAFSKDADVVIGIGELIEYLPRYDVNIPMNSTIDTSKWKPKYETNNKKIKIVHASNHRMFKGTRFLVKVCEDLKKQGYNIELVLVEGMRNEDAKKIYESADIIADQFLIGWFALFAAEGMALGKPVMCYLRDSIIEANKQYAKDCPLFNTNPDNLKENLIKLIKSKKLRVDLGKRGRKFVEKYGITYVGKQLDMVYEQLWSDKK